MAIIAAKIAARADDGDIIDNEAFGQPFKYPDKKDSDFAEWDQQVGIFMGARFGQEIFGAMSWAKKQKKHIVKVVPTFGDGRFIAYSDAYGDDANVTDHIPELECKPSCSKQW